MRPLQLHEENDGAADSEPMVALSFQPPARPPLPWLDLAEWTDQDPPDRQWLVPGLIPDGCVTSLYGDGGSGKTMLALWLMAAMAARNSTPWLDEKVYGWKSVGLFAEDDGPELTRRLRRISEALGVPFENVARDVTPLPGVGLDTVVASIGEYGECLITPMMEDLIAKVRETNAGLLVLDYAAAIFGGNELDRYQVSAFMRRLNAIARDNQIAILLLGHPSMEGMKGGRGTSGSTAWRNQARSFLHLTVDDVQDDPEGRTLLTLRHTKSNYGRSGRTYHLASDGSRFEILDTEAREKTRTKGPRLSAAQKVALAALQRAVADGGLPSPGGIVPLGSACATIELWRQYAYSASISPSDGTEARRRAFHRAKIDLQSKGLVGVAEPLAWISEGAGQ